MRRIGLCTLVLTAAVLLTTTRAAWAENPTVVLHTSLGEIEIQLDAKKAPETVSNFLAYVRSGFYNGAIFHRVIPGFMVQGGGFDPDMNKKEPNEPITNEADNGLKNVSGSIAMARTSAPHSATSQFFINVADNDNLDHTKKSGRGWGYAVFGQVTKGMEVVKKIESVPTVTRRPYRNVPRETVVISKVEIRKPASE